MLDDEKVKPLGNRRIPEAELHFNFSLSGGPGGQNVNKTATKVEVRWKVSKSNIFNQAEKEVLLASKQLKNRLNYKGEVVLQHSRTRSQNKNKVEIVNKLHSLIQEALKIKKKRIASKTPKKQIEKRLKNKRVTGQKKNLRRTPANED